MTEATGSEDTGGSEIADVLAAGLVELIEELCDGGIDLPAAASMVQRDFTLAVRSLLAVTLVVGLESAPPVTLTLASGPVAARDVGSAFSLRLDSDPGTRLALTCYASRPEALTELAGDLAAALELPATLVDLRPGLPDHDLVPGLHGMEEFRAVHEDVGARRAALAS